MTGQMHVCMSTELGLVVFFLLGGGIPLGRMRCGSAQVIKERQGMDAPKNVCAYQKSNEESMHERSSALG